MFDSSYVYIVIRLLAFATAFATKVIRKYGLLQHNKDTLKPRGSRGNQEFSLPPDPTCKKHDGVGNSRRLRDMAQFLVIIRNLQRQLNAKFKRPSQGLVWSHLILLIFGVTKFI